MDLKKFWVWKSFGSKKKVSKKIFVSKKFWVRTKFRPEKILDPDPAKSKTKCLFFSRKRKVSEIKNVMLNGDALPWVESAKHLGNLLTSKIDFSCYSPETKADLLVKRAIFFGKVHQIQQQFGSYHPRLILKLLSIYSTAFYGSDLWNINTEEYQRLVRSWNTACKMIWDLPHPTHTRLLESLSPVPHLENVLHRRYLGFIQNLRKSSKPLLQLIYSSSSKDLSSLTGQNINFLKLKYGKSSVGELLGISLKGRQVYPLPNDEAWKISLIEELILVRKEFLVIDFDENLLDDILLEVCTA